MGYKGWENFQYGRPQNPVRQAKGAMARSLGAGLEDYIEAACKVYHMKHLARVEKTPEPFKIMGAKHRLSNGAFGFEGVFSHAAQPDFKGTIKGGRSVVFEAKASSTGVIHQDVVTDEQWAAMDDHEALGAIVFVVVSLSLRTFYRVPWATWTAMKAKYGHKHMTAEELEEYRIPIKNGFLRIFEELEDCI